MPANRRIEVKRLLQAIHKHRRVLYHPGGVLCNWLYYDLNIIKLILYLHADVNDATQETHCSGTLKDELAVLLSVLRIYSCNTWFYELNEWSFAVTLNPDSPFETYIKRMGWVRDQGANRMLRFSVLPRILLNSPLIVVTLQAYSIVVTLLAYSIYSPWKLQTKAKKSCKVISDLPDCRYARCCRRSWSNLARTHRMKGNTLRCFHTHQDTNLQVTTWHNSARTIENRQ